jgi:hypothetical protein
MMAKMPETEVYESAILKMAGKFAPQLQAFLERCFPGTRSWTCTSVYRYELRGALQVFDGLGKPITKMLIAVHFDKPDRVLVTHGGNQPRTTSTAIDKYFGVPRMQDNRIAWCNPVGLLEHPLTGIGDRPETITGDSGRCEDLGYMRFNASGRRQHPLRVRWVTPDVILLLGGCDVAYTLLPRYMLDIMAERPPTQET